MRRQYFVACGLALLLSGCGEQTPPVPSASSAEGLWTGTTATNRTVTAAVLEDGVSYFFYSAPGNPNQIAGVLQGQGTSDKGNFTASHAKDFGIGLATLETTVSATYAARQFLNGSFTDSGTGTVAFTSAYNPAYETTPSVTSLAGLYTGQAGSSRGVQTATITAATDGTFTGSEQNGCTFAGRTTARTHGNIFDQSVTFGGPPCFFPGSTFQGIVYFDIATRRFYSAAPNGPRTDAAIFFGIKIL